ncbi:hypothetical protein BH23GEM9_BH23GEM9_03760 [soil metagenome]
MRNTLVDRTTAALCSGAHQWNPAKPLVRGPA